MPEAIPMPERAVIDIGSNTVRLVIYGGPPRAPKVLHNEKVSAKLGRGVIETGHLSQKSMNAALKALRRYAALLAFKGIADVRTVATAAARDAANGPEFLAAVAATGLAPRLISGEEEALTSARGVAFAFPGARGVVADLGGGSLELVHIDGAHSEHGLSLPLGSLRLPQMRTVGPAAFARRVRAMVHDSAWQCAPGEALYLVGGSFRAFARYAAWQQDWPLDDPHGFELSGEQALALCRKLALARLAVAVPGVPASRAASLSDTGALLAALVREALPARLVFSAWGLREGVLFGDAASDLQAQDPLLAGVAAFAAQQGIDAASALMVARWTAGVRPEAAANRATLRLAASMLALASQPIEPNRRPDLVLDWALRKRWIGIDAPGRAVIAACLLANAGRNVLPPALSRLAPAESLAEGQVWGAAIRLCRRFSDCCAAALADSALAIAGSRLVLTLGKNAAPLCTDMTEKDLKLLAALLGLESSIERPASVKSPGKACPAGG